MWQVRLVRCSKWNKARNWVAYSSEGAVIRPNSLVDICYWWYFNLIKDGIKWSSTIKIRKWVAAKRVRRIERSALIILRYSLRNAKLNCDFTSSCIKLRLTNQRSSKSNRIIELREGSLNHRAKVRDWNLEVCFVNHDGE